jgi:O-antigen ligase
VIDILRGSSGSGAPRRAADPERLRIIVAVAIAAVVLGAGIFLLPVRGPGGLLLAVCGAAVVALLLGSPVAAFAALMVTSFLRIVLQGTGLPAEPMVLVMVALVVAGGVSAARGVIRLHLGGLEVAMAAYLVWNVVSMIAPHDLPPIEPLTGATISVYRFILTGTALPFIAYVMARALLRSKDRVRRTMIGIVILAAYSVVVSIMQFTGPKELVWPPYIAYAPNYPERAVGVFNQPVVNGMLLVAGFVIGLMLAQDRTLKPGLRVTMLLVAVACIPAVYLTKTRAAWLVFALGVVACALFARGARKGFVVTLVAAVLFVGVNWATFTSTDRTAGGVGSTSEVEDRLNSIATSFYAIDQKPVLGWGVARFAQVNAHYHKQWEPSSTFQRGFGIASHENELGIFTELGAVGMVLWLAVIIGVVANVVRALRRLPIGGGVTGRGLGLIALTVFATWIVTGFTADLRYFDFANLLTFTLVGATVGVAEDAARRAEQEKAERCGDESVTGRALTASMSTVVTRE